MMHVIICGSWILEIADWTDIATVGTSHLVSVIPCFLEQFQAGPTMKLRLMPMIKCLEIDGHGQHHWAQCEDSHEPEPKAPSPQRARWCTGPKAAVKSYGQHMQQVIRRSMTCALTANPGGVPGAYLIGDNDSRGFWLPPVSNLCLMKANDTRGLWVSPIATALSAAYL